MSDTNETSTSTTTIVNLTPHAIGFKRNGSDGQVRVVPPVRPAVRVVTRVGERLGELDGLDLFGPPIYTRIANLPPKATGKIFVVSQIAALAISELDPERDDVFWPATTREEGATRESGGVIAVSRLNRAV